MPGKITIFRTNAIVASHLEPAPKQGSRMKELMRRLGGQRVGASLAVAALFAFSAASAQAATYNWDPGMTPSGTAANPVGSGGTGTWDLTTQEFSNGTTDVAWTDTTGLVDIARFGGAAGTVTLNTNLGALGLVFQTSGYTIAGTGVLSLGGSGIDTSLLTTAGSTTTIGNAITLTAVQTWTNGSGDTLNFNGLVNGGGKQLTVGGTGIVNFAGGTTGFGTNSTFSSGTNVNITANSSFGILFANGNTTIPSGTTSTASIIVVDKTGVFTVSGTGILNSTAGGFRIGSTSGQAANLTVGAGGQVTVGTASIEFNHAGGSGVASNLNLNGGTFTTPLGFTMTGLGIINFNGGTLALTNTLANIAATNTGNLTLNVQSGGGIINVAAAKTVTFSQVLTHNSTGVDGGLTLNGAGTLTLTGANTYNGDTVINAGTLTVGNALALQNSALNYNNQGGTVNFGALTAATLGGLKGAQNLPSSSLTTLTLNPSAGATPSYSGVLSNNAAALAVTKTGAGTQTLTGANTYTGATTVNAGTLILAGANTSTGATTINAGTLILTGTNANTGATTINAGILNLSGAGATLGNTAITAASGGTFAATPGTGTNSAGTGTAKLTVSAGGAFTMADNAIGTFNLNGTGGSTALTAGSASGTAAAFTFNIFGDGTTNTADLLNVTGNAAFGATGAAITLVPTTTATGLVAGNVTLINAGGGLVTGSGGFSLASPTVNVGSTTYALSLGMSTATMEILSITPVVQQAFYWTGDQSSIWNTNNSGNTNFATDATGATDTGSLPGATSDVVFAANNANTANLNTTLGQDFAISSLTFTGTGTPVAATPVTIGGTNTLTLNANPGLYAGGTGILVQAGSAANTISSNVALGAAQAWTNNSASTLTVSGTVSGTPALTTNGPGTIVLSGTGNTYSGGTTVNQGTLTANNTGGLGTGSITVNPTVATGTASDNATLNTNGSIASNASVTVNSEASDGGFGIGTLNFNGTAPTIGSLAGSGHVVLNNAAGTNLTTGGLNASPTFSGVISDGAGTGSLTKVGTGTLTLTGANTYTGGTNINAGSIAIKSGAAISASSLVTVASGAQLQLVPGVDGTTVNLPFALNLTYNSTTPSVINPSNNTLTYNFNNGITLNNGGYIQVFGINNTINFKGITGTASTTSTGTTTTNNLLLTATGNNSGVHTYVFTTPTTYTGNTTLSSVTAPATLKLGVTNGLPTTTYLTLLTGNSTNGKQATLDIAGNSQTLAGLTTVIGTSLTAANSEVVNTGGAPATLTINNAATDTIAGLITGTGLSLSKTNTATLILSGANTYTGGTTIAAGAIQMTGSGKLGATTGNLTINTNGSLDLNGLAQTVNALSGTATGQAIGSGATGPVTLTIGNGNGSGSFGGIIADKAAVFTGTPVVALTKAGTGTQVLTGADTYSGGTTISAGALSGPTQAYSTGGVTVAAAATADYTQNTASTYAASITGSGSVTVGANPGGGLTGGGTITYTNVDSATGGTTVKTGTLLLNHTGGGAVTGPVGAATTGIVGLGSDGQIAASSNVSLLDAGILAANGHNDGAGTKGGAVTPTQGLGTLQVGSPTDVALATIDFGDPTGSANGGAGNVLAFADSSGLTWNGTLNIANYTGAVDQLYVGTTAGGLTPTQLGEITFNGSGSAMQLSNGEVVMSPTPEPSGWASMLSGVGLLGGIIACKRRKAGSIAA